MNYKWLIETLGRGLIVLVFLSVIGWVVESAYLFYLNPMNFFVGTSKIAGLIVAGALGALILGAVIRGVEVLLANKKPAAPPAPPEPPTVDPAKPVV